MDTVVQAVPRVTVLASDRPDSGRSAAFLRAWGSVEEHPEHTADRSFAPRIRQPRGEVRQADDSRVPLLTWGPTQPVGHACSRRGIDTNQPQELNSRCHPRWRSSNDI
eukprot:3993013-Pyramimonas_sp.AAC.1